MSVNRFLKFYMNLFLEKEAELNFIDIKNEKYKKRFTKLLITYAIPPDHSTNINASNVRFLEAELDSFYVKQSKEAHIRSESKWHVKGEKTIIYIFFK